MTSRIVLVLILLPFISGFVCTKVNRGFFLKIDSVKIDNLEFDEKLRKSTCKVNIVKANINETKEFNNFLQEKIQKNLVVGTFFNLYRKDLDSYAIKYLTVVNSNDTKKDIKYIFAYTVKTVPEERNDNEMIRVHYKKMLSNCLDLEVTEDLFVEDMFKK